MEKQEGASHGPEREESHPSAARFSVGCGVAALLFMIVAVITDNVFLFVPMLLLGIVGLISGLIHLSDSESDRGVAVLGIVLSGIWAFLGAAFLLILAMWDSNL